MSFIESEFSDVQWFGKIRVSAAEFFARCGDEPGPRRVDIVLHSEGSPVLASSGIWSGEVESDDEGEFVEVIIPAMIGMPQRVQ